MRCRLPLAIILIYCFSFIAQSAFGSAPAWWSQRGILSANAPADYAAINQGQLKNLATAAAAELDADLPGGAGDAIHTMVNNWYNNEYSSTNVADYNAVTLGQLKTVAQPFYDQLIAVTYTNAYPWSASTNAADFSMANIGQVKNLFSFDLTSTDPAYDTNNDGIPDWWERYYGITNANALALRGDGLSNLQAYQQGQNPNDYYDGTLPTLSLLGGGGQFGNPGTTATMPLSISVQGDQYDYYYGELSNAPVTISVTSGHALLSVNGSTPSSSVQARSTSTYTDLQGGSHTVAQASILLPNIPGETSFISITAKSGNQTTVPITTTVSAINSSLQTPTGLTAVPTSPTTDALSWTPSDTNQPTSIQVSSDGGADWSFVQVVPAGQSSVTLTGLTPDQTVIYRLCTGDYTSN